MRVQRFEGLPITNQVFKSSSNNKNNMYGKSFYEMDSIDAALRTDSLDEPLIPQIARKFQKAFNIAFSPKVIEEAQKMHDKVNTFHDKSKFSAVA